MHTIFKKVLFSNLKIRHFYLIRLQTSSIFKRSSLLTLQLPESRVVSLIFVLLEHTG